MRRTFLFLLVGLAMLALGLVVVTAWNSGVDDGEGPMTFSIAAHQDQERVRLERGVLHFSDAHFAALPEPMRMAWEDALRAGEANFTLTPSEARSMTEVFQSVALEQDAPPPWYYEYRGVVFQMSSLVH